MNPTPPRGSHADELRELLPAYAIGALTDEEGRRVRQLLHQHPELLPELDEFQALAEGLLLNVEPVQPRPGLRNRLLTQLAEEEAAVTASTTASTTRPSMTTSSAAATPVMPVTPTPVSPMPLARTGRMLRTGWMLAAACLALLLLTNIYWLSTSNSLRTELDELQRQQDSLVANLVSEKVQHVGLHAADERAQIASIAWNSETEQATFYGAQLPEIDDNQVYQLWLQTGETMVSAGVFPPSIQGGFHTFHAEMVGYEAVAITIEPAGGSDAPTTQPFAIGALSS